MPTLYIGSSGGKHPGAATSWSLAPREDLPAPGITLIIYLIFSTSYF